VTVLVLLAAAPDVVLYRWRNYHPVPSSAMNKSLHILKQYVGRSLVLVKADGVDLPWSSFGTQTCECLELMFDNGYVLTLSCEGGGHFYGESDLKLTTSEGDTLTKLETLPLLFCLEHVGYWLYEPTSGINLWPAKYLVHLELCGATDTLSAGYLVAGAGGPPTIDTNNIHVTTTEIQGTPEGLQRRML
jgi:hypothetical protein